MDDDYYQHFTTETFIEDDFFRSWVLNPGPETIAFWEDFIKQYPEKAHAIQEAKQLLLSLHGYYEKEAGQVSKEKARASFRKVAERMKGPAEVAPLKRRRWLAPAVAASLLLLLAMGSFFFFPKENGRITFTTGNGMRLPVELPDGSKVQLNANSTLYYYKKDWEKKGERKAWLEGEAWFDVQRAPSGAKFTVHTDGIKVEVLGTKFNVRSRDGKSEVVLAEGQVELDVADQHITMRPGDLVSFSSRQSKVESRKVKPADYTAWKDGITVFNNTLSEVVKELEILYGVSFIIKNEQLKERKIQLSAPADSLEQVLETLELLYSEEIRIEKAEDKVVIY